MRVSHVFFFTTIEQLEANKGEALIEANRATLNVLEGPDVLTEMSYDQVKARVETAKVPEFKNIRLSFERFYDFSTRVDFVPFYYQEEIEAQGKIKSQHPYIILLNVEKK